jgi:saccharopine dehydrogenase-like NADP-dependent oxidoreductase
MIPQQFAIAIVLPDTTSLDIVTAAIKFKVHIIDKENYDERKDYTLVTDMYPLPDGNKIRLLFVIGKGEFVLAETAAEVSEARAQINLKTNFTEKKTTNV